LITSSQLQKEQDFFINFIDGYSTVKEFCSQVRLELYWWFPCHQVLLCNVNGCFLSQNYTFYVKLFL